MFDGVGWPLRECKVNKLKAKLAMVIILKAALRRRRRSGESGSV